MDGGESLLAHTASDASTWGLAQLEKGDLEAATASLRQAVVLGPERSGAYFNLGLVYVKRAMLADAEQEMLEAMRRDPEDPDSQNMLALVQIW